MDDLKISLIDRRVILHTILWLESTYCKMHSICGQQYEYLGMLMESSKKGGVRISMEGYLKEILEDFLEGITGRAVTQAATHLF